MAFAIGFAFGPALPCSAALGPQETAWPTLSLTRFRCGMSPNWLGTTLEAHSRALTARVETFWSLRIRCLKVRVERLEGEGFELVSESRPATPPREAASIPSCPAASSPYRPAERTRPSSSSSGGRLFRARGREVPWTGCRRDWCLHSAAALAEETGAAAAVRRLISPRSTWSSRTSRRNLF